jgi:hypothetical protein
MKFYLSLAVSIIFIFHNGCKEDKRPIEKLNNTLWVSFEKDFRSDTTTVMGANPFTDHLSESWFFINDSCYRFTIGQGIQKHFISGSTFTLNGDKRETAKIIQFNDSVMTVEYYLEDLLSAKTSPKMVIERREFHKYPLQSTSEKNRDIMQLPELLNKSVWRASAFHPQNMSDFSFYLDSYKINSDVNGGNSITASGKSTITDTHGKMFNSLVFVSAKSFMDCSFIEFYFHYGSYSYRTSYLIDKIDEHSNVLISWKDNKFEQTILQKVCNTPDSNYTDRLTKKVIGRWEANNSKLIMMSNSYEYSFYNKQEENYVSSWRFSVDDTNIILENDSSFLNIDTVNNVLIDKKTNAKFSKK